MKILNRVIPKVKFVLAGTVCAVTIASAAVWSQAAFRSDIQPEIHSVQPPVQKAQQSEPQHAERQADPQPVVTEQEIDGKIWKVHEELPIVAPSIAPDQAQNVSIVINKSEHILTLYNNESVIAMYSAGFGIVPGAKEKKNDKRTPEGEYSICTLNSGSKYYLGLGLNYPNANDAKRGLESGLITQGEYDDIVAAVNEGREPNWYTNLGGQIMIHGQKGNLGGQTDWTTGCIGVNNQVMDILWQYCKVGTKVTIYS